MDSLSDLIQDLDLLRKFAEETEENLTRFERELEALTTSPNQMECLTRPLRTIHTIKGTAGLLALDDVVDLAHAVESLLIAVREGHRRWEAAFAHQVFALAETLRKTVWSIASAGSTKLNENRTSASSRSNQVHRSNEAGRSVTRAAHFHRSALTIGNAPAGLNSKPRGTDANNHRSLRRSHMLRYSAAVTRQPVVEQRRDCRPDNINERHSKPVASPRPATPSTENLDPLLIEKLTRLTDQLPVVQQQIQKFSQSQEAGKLDLAFRWLNLIRSEMRDTLRKLDWEPIGNSWNALPILLRELAATCGKQVQLKIEGADTKLDKQVVRAIHHALIHLLRNAVDHGIEPQELREAHGKLSVATIWLRASVSRDQVHIEIKDDGRGVDVEQVKQQSLRRGLITPQEAARMSAPELTQLILRPGLSTASKVTDLSGRGIGLDAARASVEELGGTLELRSTHGQGTTIRLQLPLGGVAVG